MAWADLELAGLRPATQTRYRVSLKALHRHLAHRAIEQLGPADFHAYALARIRGGVKPATVRRDLTVASRVMKVAARAGWITSNPVAGELGALEEKREPVQPVPLRTIAAMIAAAPSGLAALTRVLARTGCRQEEGASLEWRQVDLPRGTATFGHTKTRSPRVIQLSPQTIRDLRRIKRSSTCPFVFRGRDDARLQSVSSRYRELVTRTMGRLIAGGGSGVFVPGARFRCHDLRHTYAIRALQKGASIYTLARHLGHSTTRTTEVYAGWLSRRPE